VPDFALVAGNPIRGVSRMSEAGRKLHFDKEGFSFCEKSKKIYKLKNGLVSETYIKLDIQSYCGQNKMITSNAIIMSNTN